MVRRKGVGFRTSNFVQNFEMNSIIRYAFATQRQHIGENIFVFTKSIYYYIIKESAKSLTRPFIFH